MKYMRFSHRIAASFTVILAIATSVCLVSIIFVQKLGRNSQMMYDHPLTVSNAVRDINIHINAIHRTMKDVASAENDEELFVAVEKVTLSNQAIHQSFAVVKERFLGDHAILDAAYNVYVDWEPIRKEVIKLKSAGDNEAAIRITKGKGARHVELLFGKTKELTDFAQGKADEFYQYTKRSERNSYYMFGAGIVILISIGSICVFWLSNSITNPLSQFIRNLASILQRDGPLDIEMKGLSEQSIFDTTLNELENAYKKLKDYNSELDLRVAERTEALSIREAELRESNTQFKELNERFKQQNSDLEDAKEKAEESDRLKSAFLANMSHEIRTPMNAIIGFTGLLNDESTTEERRSEYISLIHSAGNQLLRLISDIVDLAKIDAKQLSIEPSPTHLKSFVDGVYKRFEISVSPTGPQLVSDIQVDDGIWAEFDEQRLTQVVSNLLENAFKYTDEGQIELACKIADGNILFCVKDTGIGIPAEDQEKIFKRFHQIERNDDNKLREGTGLGLSICQALTKLMGGTICLNSKVNEGSAFYISVPYLPCNQTNAQAENPLASNGNNNGATILIVEDERSNRLLLQAILEATHFNVISANDGLEAVEILRSGTRPNLILMDLKMPRMDGYEALKHVKQICPTIPIIAQTAYAMANDRMKVLDAGFNDYISKPISGPALLEKIDRFLDKSAV